MTFNGLLDLIEFVKNEYPTLKNNNLTVFKI